MKNEWNVIVVGGGAAGLMAAGIAAQNGVSTLLLEKMEKPGRKLSITGKGRCNLTNQKDLREFISHFGKQGSFLYQAFSHFFVSDLITFMESQGIQTIVERGDRIFPANDDAKSITEKLIAWTRSQGVEIRTNSAVKELHVQNKQIQGVILTDGQFVPAKTVIVATGGASYTGTGSTGDGYAMAANAGHRLIPIRPALVPLKTRDDTASRLQGLSLRNVRATVLVEGKKVSSEFGEMLFTHFGLSGPIILTLSGLVVDALRENQKVEISIDLKPALDEKKLDVRLLRELDAHGNQFYTSILKTLLPQKLIAVCVQQTAIPAEKPASQINAEERKRLLHWLKDFRFMVTESLPLETAIITAGGICLDEIDPRTLQSKLIEGLYFAGEILDLNADTGGYNLQAAFSTGWLAGQSAAEVLYKKM